MDQPNSKRLASFLLFFSVCFKCHSLSSFLQKLESQMRDIAYGTKQYKAAPSEVEFFALLSSPFLSFVSVALYEFRI